MERPHEERRQTLSKDLKDVRRETHRHLGGGVLSLGNNRCQQEWTRHDRNSRKARLTGQRAPGETQ